MHAGESLAPLCKTAVSRTAELYETTAAWRSTDNQTASVKALGCEREGRGVAIEPSGPCPGRSEASANSPHLGPIIQIMI